jgi:hypothetical protein
MQALAADVGGNDNALEAKQSGRGKWSDSRDEWVSLGHLASSSWTGPVDKVVIER